MIPYTRQSISEDDIEAVNQVLRSELITQGPVAGKFESAIADYCSVKFAIAVSHGTAALHLACLALGIGRGDRVWTSPNTFVASANCVLYCGAEVDFVDIDPASYNISIVALENKLHLARQSNALPKAIIAVHFAGQSCDMQAIKQLSKQYGFYIIEDAAHALGGEYQGNKIGCCQYSDISIFSFHPAKMITSGEGGMIVTNNEKLAEKARTLREHGIIRNPEQMLGSADGNWYYEQQELGFNYRLTDIQAALGLSQLKKLDHFVNKRRELAEYYDTLLSELPVQTPKQNPDTQSSWHLYVIQLIPHLTAKNRKELYDFLRQNNVGVQVHYIPVYRQAFYKNKGFDARDFPVCEKYYASTLTLPLYVNLDKSTIKDIVSMMFKVLDS